MSKMPLPQLGKSRGDFTGQITSFMRLRMSPAKRMEKSLDTKTRKIFELVRQHIHEICAHAYDGTNGKGEPVLGVIDSGECISDPCVSINENLKVMSIG